ncbi:hypothetical protein JAAARDRAFT_187630 [Jaapia argillacea MUCL 33604]|uniref:Uncharacterized protein n=1 Tax=Jaapia argillacea MUCL 33604 TaxID=933084 RepID=A0A067QB47_9AGAM|nr:hypothetical protein JAAARDRAFT_187630 [Jaapia argillacea MUCL 33604]
MFESRLATHEPMGSRNASTVTFVMSENNDPPLLSPSMVLVGLLTLEWSIVTVLWVPVRVFAAPAVKPLYRISYMLIVASGVCYLASSAMTFAMTILLDPGWSSQFVIMSNCANGAYNLGSSALLYVLFSMLHQGVRFSLHHRNPPGLIWNRSLILSAVLLLFLLGSIPFIISLYANLSGHQGATLRDSASIMYIIYLCFRVFVQIYLLVLSWVARKGGMNTPFGLPTFYAPMLLVTSVIMAFAGAFLAEGPISITNIQRLDTTFRVFQGIPEFIALYALVGHSPVFRRAEVVEACCTASDVHSPPHFQTPLPRTFFDGAGLSCGYFTFLMLGYLASSFKLLERGSSWGGHNVSTLTYIISENNDPPILSSDGFAVGLAAVEWGVVWLIALHRSGLLSASGLCFAAYYVIEFALALLPEPGTDRSYVVMSNCGNQAYNVGLCLMLYIIFSSVLQQVRDSPTYTSPQRWCWEPFVVYSSVLSLFLLGSIPFVLSMYGTYHGDMSLADAVAITYIFFLLGRVVVQYYLLCLSSSVDTPQTPFSYSLVALPLFITSIIMAIIGAVLAKGSQSTRVSRRLDIAYRIFQALPEFFIYLSMLSLPRPGARRSSRAPAVDLAMNYVEAAAAQTK